MTCVIAETCIDGKDGTRTRICPVETIWYGDDLPVQSTGFVATDSEFFDDAVTGRVQPGALSPESRTKKDHSVVVA